MNKVTGGRFSVIMNAHKHRKLVESPLLKRWSGMKALVLDTGDDCAKPVKTSVTFNTPHQKKTSAQERV